MASEQGLREALEKLHETQLCVVRHDTTTTHLCSLLDRMIRSVNAPTAYFVARAAHALTVLEGHLGDTPADFRPQHHALARAQGADGGGIVDQRLGFDTTNFDRRGPATRCRTAATPGCRTGGPRRAIARG